MRLSGRLQVHRSDGERTRRASWVPSGGRCEGIQDGHLPAEEKVSRRFVSRYEDLRDIAPAVSVREVVIAVCERFMISPQSLLGRLRFKEFCQPRHMAYLLAYELTYQSLTDIGQAMDRDHTTILHGVRTMRIAIKKDPALARAYQELTAALGAAHEIGA
jgi:hypothetical protein